MGGPLLVLSTPYDALTSCGCSSHKRYCKFSCAKDIYNGLLKRASHPPTAQQLTMKFIFFTEFAEILDTALYMQNVEKQEVLVHIADHTYKKLGDGMIDKIDDWWNYTGKGYIWIFDSCEFGDLQDWLRSKGEKVVGGSKNGDKLENDRQLGQKWFKAAGFKQPFSQNFKDIDQALEFIKKNLDKRYILKQNGNAPKHLNHLGKFDGGEDMIFHMEELKKHWNEAEFGKFDCDLMEVVEGLEVAASAFFDGKQFIKNKSGKVIGFLNFEEKKESDGGLGETTGETGTTFIGVTEDNKLFKEIMLKPKIAQVLAKSGFQGVFDINCIKTKEGIVALEPTCRPGVPATAYEFIEGLKSPTASLFEALAGSQKPIEIHEGFGMVMVVFAKPFPIENDVPETDTSITEKLWILNKEKPVKEFSDDQRKHIHLINFEKKDGDYRVATKSGYLLTVTGRGKTVEDTRKNLIEYIKQNLYLSGMKYRTDIGKRVEKYV